MDDFGFIDTGSWGDEVLDIIEKEQSNALTEFMGTTMTTETMITETTTHSDDDSSTTTTTEVSTTTRSCESRHDCEGFCDDDTNYDKMCARLTGPIDTVLPPTSTSTSEPEPTDDPEDERPCESMDDCVDFCEFDSNAICEDDMCQCLTGPIDTVLLPLQPTFTIVPAPDPVDCGPFDIFCW